MGNDVKRYRLHDPERRYGEQQIKIDMVRYDDYAVLEAECERLRSVMMTAVTNHFAKGWSRAAKEKELDQYLSEGIRQLEAERDALAAELQVLKAQQAEQKPACEVSAEIYLPDGTSDFITRRLPIGTKLYVAPPAAQDVSALVWALEQLRAVMAGHDSTPEEINALALADAQLQAHGQAQQQADQPPPASSPRQK